MTSLAELPEGQLKVSMLKLAGLIVVALSVLGLAFSAIAGRGQGLASTVMLLSIAFAFLMNGVLALLKIIDWFATRERLDV